MIRLVHGRIELALHEVRTSPGPTLLLLHALRASSAGWVEAVAAWPGTVFALDFAGHGQSGWFKGGGYCPELFAADADVALAEIGQAYLAGAGLGAYVSLLVAGGRPELVPGALLLPGEGLAGGGPIPDFERIVPRFRAELEPLAASLESRERESDPLLRTVEFDIRPPDYALAFAARAKRLLMAEDGADRPPWWAAVRGHATTEPAAPHLDSALLQLAAQA